MTPKDFADLAHRLGPNVQGRAILEAVQFRVGGKAFATLGWPAAGWAVMKLAPSRQAWALSLSEALAPEPGRRRKDGIVLARLGGLDADIAAVLLAEAWRHVQAAASPQRAGRAPQLGHSRDRVERPVRG